MIVIKNGDILNANENLICHQVNVDGVMGEGLALQIANKYPQVEKEYKDFVKFFKNQGLLGQYQAIKINDTQYIVNCFSQRKNLDTEYYYLEVIFKGLFETCKKNNFTIAVPYGYGCGIANGDWEKVLEIFKKLSDEYETDISVYRLGDSK